jgi:hypothetical protein
MLTDVGKESNGQQGTRQMGQGKGPAQERRGTTGEDLVFGDQVSESGEPIKLIAQAGNGGPDRSGKENASVSAFDDTLDGGGRDLVVGDAIAWAGGMVSLGVRAGNGRRGEGDGSGAPGTGGDGALVDAFNDGLKGGGGQDKLVGDVAVEGSGRTSFVVAVGGGGRNTGVEAPAAALVAGGGAGFVFAANDTLDGGTGADRLVGDIASRAGTGPVTLRIACANGGGPNGGGDGGTLNNAFVFNDVITGGEGLGLVVGDILRERSTGETRLSCEVGNGGGQRPDTGGFGGSGGDLSNVDAFGDALRGGRDQDLIVGDVAYSRTQGTLALLVDVGSAGRYDFDPLAFFGASAGDGGSDGEARVFSDTLSGAQGDDVLAGDVYRADGSGAIELTAIAGQGGMSGYYGGGNGGGDENLATAFADSLAGGAGRDTLVGDLYSIGPGGDTGSIRFVAAAGVGGDKGGAQSNPGGRGGDFNAVSAFSDQIRGGHGDDRIAGDAAFEDRAALSSGIEVLLQAGVDGFLSRNGGLGNVIGAFNDTCSGGAGDDVLVGDFVFAVLPTGFLVRIEGEADDEILAFADSLDGGSGDDRLLGDFGSVVPDIDIEGAFVARESLFADRLSGGEGDDFLAGNLGADTLEGGAGADRFFWQGGDLFSMATGSVDGSPPVDIIRDFSIEDVIDVGVLLLTLGLDGSALSMRAEDDDTIFAIDQEGTGVSADDFLRLNGFTTALSLQDLIDGGILLV